MGGAHIDRFTDLGPRAGEIRVKIDHDDEGTPELVLELENSQEGARAMTTEAAVTHTRTPVASVLRLTGEHDMATVDQVRHAVADALECCPAVVVDLSQIAFMDISPLRLLLELHDGADRSGKRLEVVVPSIRMAPCWHLLVDLLPEVGERLHLNPTLGEALQSIDRWRAVRHPAPC